jgi:hypothetical protein
MANRSAAYKNKYLLDNVEQWWTMTPGQPFTSVDDMYVSYVRRQLDSMEYEAIMAIDDFQRCLYSQGICRLGNGVNGSFARLDTWRPSHNQVMRFSLWETENV